jgi:hypothetical protein
VVTGKAGSRIQGLMIRFEARLNYSGVENIK